MAEPLLQMEGVTRRFDGRAVLDGLSWRLEPGECAVLLGPSGGGKTVFLHTLLGLEPPDAGTVSMPGLRGEHPFAAIAVLFQQDALLDDLSVEANLAVASCERLDAALRPIDAELSARIEAALREVELDPARVRRALPATLSGGMRRRAALARALIRGPRVLIADEPTSGLDPAAAERIYELLAGLIQRRSMSAVIITHDPACAARLGFPVYYFAPAGSRMPRWSPPAGVEGEERMKLLVEWMREQAREFARRCEAPSDAAEVPSPPMTPLSVRVNRVIDALGRAVLRLARVPRGLALHPWLHETRLWVVESLPLLAMIFLMLGVVVEVQSEQALVRYGASNRLPELMARALVRVAPLLMGFLLAGRCGSAVASRLGWMQYSGQIRALRTMRIDPDEALLPPLLAALTLGAPLLALAGLGLAALGGGAALASPLAQARITTLFYAREFVGAIAPAALALLLVKALLIGVGVALLTYGLAMRPKYAPADVARAITTGLVGSFLWISAVDTALSLMFPNA